MKTYLARLITIAVLAATALMGGASTVAGASGLNVNISPQAQLWAYAPGYNGVFVTFTYQCSVAGTGTIMVSVNQSATQSNAGNASSGNGSTSATCDGTSHKVAISVLGNPFPGFNIGTADVRAVLTDPSGAGAMDAKTVRVTHP
jgi:hypothetical protein